MDANQQEFTQALNQLLDEYRVECLWFLRADFYPVTPQEQLRVLRYIQRYGDRAAFARAAQLRQWLSPSSSGRSAG